MDRKISVIEKELNNSSQETYIFKGDFKDLEKKIHQMEIEFTKIQIRFEERQAKPQEVPQISYKNPVGRPPKVLQE